MIPKFPTFKKLTIDDRESIEKITGKHPPYSDFNFVSLWTWNTHDKIEISKLNNNLVVKFQDYITNEIFYSFLGNRHIDETLTELLALARKQGLDTTLRLIPDTVVKNIRHKKAFEIKEDEDGHDYILSVEEVASLAHKKHYAKRKHAKHFLEGASGHTIVVLNLKDPAVKDEIFRVFEVWRKAKGKTREESKNELVAIQRLLAEASVFDLVALGLYHKNAIVGFALGERAHHGYALFHYVKGNPQYKGIFTFLYKVLAEALLKEGFAFMNIEQDLGIEGLKKAKKQWHPVHFLKKYTISLKQ